MPHEQISRDAVTCGSDDCEPRGARRRALGIQSVVKVVKQVSLASLSAERDRLAALVEELRAQKAPSLVEATTRSAVSTRRASHVERMRDMLLLTVLLSQATYLVLSRLGLSLLGF